MCTFECLYDILINNGYERIQKTKRLLVFETFPKQYAFSENFNNVDESLIDIGGASFAAVSQHVFNNGQINWKIVAAAGLTTAVTASTGVFGKVGKWLSSL